MTVIVVSSLNKIVLCPVAKAIIKDLIGTMRNIAYVISKSTGEVPCFLSWCAIAGDGSFAVSIQSKQLLGR